MERGMVVGYDRKTPSETKQANCDIPWRQWWILLYVYTIQAYVTKRHCKLSINLRLPSFGMLCHAIWKELNWCFKGAHCIHHYGDRPDDECSKHLWHTGKVLWDHMMQYHIDSHLHTHACKNLKNNLQSSSFLKTWKHNTYSIKQSFIIVSPSHRWKLHLF